LEPKSKASSTSNPYEAYDSRPVGGSGGAAFKIPVDNSNSAKNKGQEWNYTHSKTQVHFKDYLSK